MKVESQKFFLPLNAKKYFLAICLCLLSLGLYAQQSVSILSWNLKDFGQSKSADDIAAIARIVKDYDILAVQEVVPSAAGVAAVGRLVAALNHAGSAWSYVISNKTTGASANSTERYAFLWKTAKASLVSRCVSRVASIPEIRQTIQTSNELAAIMSKES